ncbi:unnamed protein product [marine sediment metagenome]|uniref:Uncharacterized protein n=1 Tax=marine sediment metagenome TaxID=412755 RepID=X1CL74_9ZZZZ
MIFVYYCLNCDKRNLIKIVAETDKICPKCGGKIVKANVRGSVFHAGNKDYKKPLVSDSLAIHPSQITEHKKVFPDVEVTPEGQPVFTNYKQHQKYLDKAGFVKQPQKTKKVKNA